MEKYNFTFFINEQNKKKLKKTNKNSDSSPIQNENILKLSENKKNISFANDNTNFSNSYNKSNDLLKNTSTKIDILKKNKISILTHPENHYSSNSINKIMLSNYNNKAININKINNKDKLIIKYEKSSFRNINNKGQHNLSINKIGNNEDGKSFPGFYNLIQINPINNPNNEPYRSKFILDNYNYNTAIKFEKRTFWRIYYICLLSKENFINTFFFKSPLESQSLRLSLFLFRISCDLAFNALFYFSQNISDKYHYKGDNLFLFTIVNNLIISIISTFSTFILVHSLNFLTNSKDKILSIFRDKDNNLKDDKIFKINIKSRRKIYEEINIVFKFLKIKILIYIILEMLLILFFFYYIVAFCEVYKETQIDWIIDVTLSSFLSLLEELIISFIITVLYKISIKYKSKIIYKIVLFIYDLG